MDSQPFVDDIETYAQDIVDTVREPLLMLDTNLRVQSANRAFYETFMVSAVETENQLIYQLGNGQWDIPDLRTLLEDVIPTSSVFNDFELEQWDNFEAQTRTIFKLMDRTLQRAGGALKNLVTMTVFITDVRNGDRFVEIRKEMFPDGNFPASALITVTGLARPGMLIEIQGIGVIGDNCSNEKPCTKR